MHSVHGVMTNSRSQLTAVLVARCGSGLFNLDDSPVVPRRTRGIAMISVRSPTAIVSAISSLLSGDGQKTKPPCNSSAEVARRGRFGPIRQPRRDLRRLSALHRPSTESLVRTVPAPQEADQTGPCEWVEVPRPSLHDRPRLSDD